MKHTTAKRKIGRNRGVARLWLEGSILAANGWTKGRRFVREDWPQSGGIPGALVYLALLPDEAPQAGERKVAGTPERPIIDTNSDSILATLGAAVGDVVEVIVMGKTITIRRA